MWYVPITEHKFLERYPILNGDTFCLCGKIINSYTKPFINSKFLGIELHCQCGLPPVLRIIPRDQNLSKELNNLITISALKTPRS